MSQYKTGTASVTNGSPTVTGTNTLWLANVTAGDSFTVAGDGVMYDVGSVDSDTQITLSAPYAGTTASGAVYAIGTGFTVPDSFPEMSQGDIETATIFTRAMRGIQSRFSGVVSDISGKAAIAVTDGLSYPNTTMASSSDISEDVRPAIAEYPHIQGFRTGTGTALTFAQVVEEAAERGARLLTIQELEAGVSRSAGFTYDNEITWTSSPAGAGLVYGNVGDGDGTRVVLNTSTDTAAGGYAVSVIGQRQWTDTQYAGLDGGASANFTAMPQVGGDPIVESGSNADGEFTRWADGTQGCRVSDFAVVQTGSGRIEAIWTFPRAFINTAYVGLGSLGVSSDFGIAKGVYSLTNRNISFANVGLKAPGSTFSPGDTGFVDSQIIGRWK